MMSEAERIVMVRYLGYLLRALLFVAVNVAWGVFLWESTGEAAMVFFGVAGFWPAAVFLIGAWVMLREAHERDVVEEEQRLSRLPSEDDERRGALSEVV